MITTVFDTLNSFLFGFYGDPINYLVESRDRTLALSTYNLEGFVSMNIMQYVNLGSSLLTILTHNEVLSYNIVLLTNITLIALSLYLLAIKLKLVRPASLLVALIVTTSQFIFWQSTQHLELTFVHAIVLLLAGALTTRTRNMSTARYLSILLLFWFLFYSSFYLAFFFLISILPSLVVFLYLKGKESVNQLKAPDNKRNYAKLPVLLGVCLIMSLPLTVVLIKLLLGKDSSSIASKGIVLALQRNSLQEVFKLSARPWDYLLPSIHHPLFGKYVESIYSYIHANWSWQAWSAYLPERAIYIGYVALALGVVALRQAVKNTAWANKKKGGYSPRSIILLFSFIGLLALWISLPPYVSIRLHKIPISPSYFLFYIFPMFRAYIRIAIIVQLCVAILAGFGLQFIFDKYKLKAPARIVVTILLGGIIIFENLSLPIPFTDVNQKPPLYTWAKEQPKDIVIAEYPMDQEPGGGCRTNLPPGTIKGYNYTYALNFQRFHNRKIFETWELDKKTKKWVWDLGNPKVYEFLKSNGVDYILAHTKDYFAYPPNPMDPCQPFAMYPNEPNVDTRFTKVAEFEDGYIYAL